MKKILLAGALTMVMTTGANATLFFSNLEIQPNAITFTVDGDMTGYTAPGGWVGNLYNFNLRYTGDLWTVGDVASANTWSDSVFDGLALSNPGNTGEFGTGVAYTWSEYNVTSLADATATNRTITLSFNQNLLNPNALDGAVEFYWGWANPNSDGFTLLGTLDVSGTSDVAEPASVALLGLGLLGIGLARRRYRA